MVRREEARMERAKEKEMRDDLRPLCNRSNFHRKYASLVSRRVCEEATRSPSRENGQILQPF